MGETVVVILAVVLVVLVINFESLANDVLKQEGRRNKAASAPYLTEMYSDRELVDKVSEKHTIDLIGREAFDEMTRRVDGIMQRHGKQPCLSLKLTSGPDTAEGARELHSVLPGEPLQLVSCSEKGVRWVDVYSRGTRIGRLGLNEATAIRETIRDNHLRAAYVAEQNCYGIDDSINLSIIIFYEPRGEKSEQTEPRRAVKCTKAGLDLCAN